jgi:methyl-accepting chemotaxis protein
MKWTIGNRLYVGFGAMTLLIGGLGFMSFRNAMQAQHTADQLSDAARELADSAELGTLVVRSRAAINRFQIEPSDANRNNYLDVVKQAQAEFEQAATEIDDPEGKRLLEETAKNYKSFTEAGDEMLKLTTDRYDVFTNQGGPAGAKLSQNLATLAQQAKADNDAARALTLTELRADVNQVRTLIARFFSLNEPADLQTANELKASIGSRLAQFGAGLPDGEFKSAVQGAQRDAEAYFATSTKVSELARAADVAREQRLFPAGDATTKANGAMQAGIIKHASEVEQQAAAAATAAKLMVGVVTGVAILVGAMCAFFIARSIIKPINLVIARLKDIAEGEGDLTQRVDENRGDELGVLGKWFNVFVVRIQNLMVEVAGSSKQVAAASTQIAASAEEMAAGLDKQTQQTQQVSAAVEEMSASVVEVAKKSSDAAGNAQQAGQQASQGGEVVMQTVTEMKSIAQTVAQSAQNVNELGKKSEQIGQIIAVINDIADQTNLLALNAAIEAARAGEHGRGFAVVADEVRKLAERTTTATEEVARSIREIQSQTSAAVEGIEAGTKKVSSGVQLASSAGQALEQIVSGSRSLQSMVQAIAAAAEEQSAASTQISKSVESINAVTREAAEGAQQSSKAAADLSAQAENLQRLVGKFKIA